MLISKSSIKKATVYRWPFSRLVQDPDILMEQPG